MNVVYYIVMYVQCPVTDSVCWYSNTGRFLVVSILTSRMIRFFTNNGYLTAFTLAILYFSFRHKNETTKHPTLFLFAFKPP